MYKLLSHLTGKRFEHFKATLGSFVSSVTYDVPWKQSDTHHFSSKYGKAQCFPVNLVFSCWTGHLSGRKGSHSTSLWAESIHEKAYQGLRTEWSKRGNHGDNSVRQGSHCLQPHSHPSWGPRGSTAAQGYVQGQKLFGWLSCISCLNTRSPSTPGTSDWARWKHFLCQIWPMGHVLNYADLVLQCLEPIPLLSKD